MLRTKLVPTTGLEIVGRGEKKPVGGTMGKEREVKKKSVSGPSVDYNSLVNIFDYFCADVPSAECVGVKLINAGDTLALISAHTLTVSLPHYV